MFDSIIFRKRCLQVIIIACVSIVCVLLSGCVGFGSDTSERKSETVETGIIIEFEEDLQNDYYISVLVNDEKYASPNQSQGEVKLFEKTLNEGEHTLTITKFTQVRLIDDEYDDYTLSEVPGEDNPVIETINVSDGDNFYFLVRSISSGLEIAEKNIITREEIDVIISSYESELQESSQPIRIVTGVDWKDEFLWHTGGEGFEILDVGADYPILISCSSSILGGRKYTLYGYNYGKIFTLRKDDPSSIISFNDTGFISIMSTRGIQDFFVGFYVDDYLTYLNEGKTDADGVKLSPEEAGVYVYNMGFHKDNAGNYVGRNRLENMSMEDATALFHELLQQAEQMPNRFETHLMDNTDRDLIINWGD